VRSVGRGWLRPLPHAEDGVAKHARDDALTYPLSCWCPNTDQCTGRSWVAGHAGNGSGHPVVRLALGMDVCAAQHLFTRVLHTYATHCGRGQRRYMRAYP
jgi:hypothetical protein